MIKVQVQHRNIGISVYPISEKVYRMVCRSNQYDGHGGFWLSDSQDVEQFLERLSPQKRREFNKGYDVNILIDGWEFRDMVGGQID